MPSPISGCVVFRRRLFYVWARVQLRCLVRVIGMAKWCYRHANVALCTMEPHYYDHPRGKRERNGKGTVVPERRGSLSYRLTCRSMAVMDPTF